MPLKGGRIPMAFQFGKQNRRSLYRGERLGETLSKELQP
jgi:hypothetical protein